MVSCIGIIGAMDEEIDAYKKHLTNVKKERWKIFTFYKGKFNGKNVVIVKCGVGKVFASMICQILIDRYKTSTILFTGVAGALNKKLNIGDVVVSIDSVHHDFNAIPLGFKRGQISYTNYRFFGAEKKLVNLALKVDISPHVIIKGRILTGDQFFTQSEKKKHKYLTDELRGDCIEMEGAAVAQVCNINQVPHLIVRTVSDNADGTAVNDYNKFKNVVASNSFKVIDGILKSL